MAAKKPDRYINEKSPRHKHMDEMALGGGWGWPGDPTSAVPPSEPTPHVGQSEHGGEYSPGSGDAGHAPNLPSRPRTSMGSKAVSLVLRMARGSR
jgi:hypothetical protein